MTLIILTLSYPLKRDFNIITRQNCKLKIQLKLCSTGSCIGNLLIQVSDNTTCIHPLLYSFLRHWTFYFTELPLLRNIHDLAWIPIGWSLIVCGGRAELWFCLNSKIWPHQTQSSFNHQTINISIQVNIMFNLNHIIDIWVFKNI